MAKSGIYYSTGRVSPGRPKTVAAMTPEQFKAGLRLVNASYGSFATYIGASQQTIYNYSRGFRPIPTVIKLTLENLIDAGGLPAEFQRKKRSREQMVEDLLSNRQEEA